LPTREPNPKQFPSSACALTVVARIRQLAKIAEMAGRATVAARRLVLVPNRPTTLLAGGLRTGRKGGATNDERGSIFT
jgi:hypothetical protein